MKAIFLCENESDVRRVYGEKELGEIRRVCETDGHIYTKRELIAMGGSDAGYIFSTWGMPRMEKDEIARYLPDARAVLYAAGSVQAFARPFIESGITVCSAWKANAVPVAEYTAALVALSAKGAFPQMRKITSSRESARRDMDARTGLYDITVGLLGLGAVGSLVAERLAACDVRVVAYDPFCPAERAERLGCELMSLERVFGESDIVSNHLANLPATRGLIKREHLFSLPENGVFINTGRGPQLDENDLYDLLRERPDTVALLDVMTDEGNSDASPLTRLPNCFLTPHVAGSMGREVRRMAHYMAVAAGQLSRGETPDCCVSMEMLDTMA